LKKFIAFIKDFFRRYPHALWALYLPVYLVMFFGIEALVPRGSVYWETSLPIDSLIPFAEVFVVPYVLWYPLLVGVGAWLLFKDGPAFRRYMWSLMLTLTFSVVFCAFVPNGQDLRPVSFPRDNIFTRLVGLLYSVDTNTNVFPSIHVVGTLAAVFAVMDTGSIKQRWVRPTVLVLSFLIIISTVLIKQHAILDMAGGIALSIVAYQLVYAPRFIPSVAVATFRQIKRVYYASRSPAWRHVVGAWCMTALWVLRHLTKTAD